MNKLSNEQIKTNLDIMCSEFYKHNCIDSAMYQKYDVKRGLRNADGTGVLAGLTNIGNVQGYLIQDNEKLPMEGHLLYRGMDLNSFVDGFMSEDRFGFEEVCYLLLFGELPNKEQLAMFESTISGMRHLPRNFTEDMIMRAPSRDVMNKFGQCIMALYAADDRADDTSLENMLRQSMEIIARAPIIIAHAYAAKRHYYDNESLYLHRTHDELSIAENFLYAVRHDNKFTKEEAKLLDLCLVLHAEHGAGNNSAFACRVVSSTGTDTYSAISAAIGSLKGPRHGGANKRVMEMFRYIENEVKDWKDEEEVTACLKKILNKEGGDGSGLIYGMGHAIYTLSDPRAVILKKCAQHLAQEKGMIDELKLIEMVERLSPALIAEGKSDENFICANVDMYSGFVYKMLGIPEELYTPLFALARMVGWCAHRIEENQTGKIIRPAFRAVAPKIPYIPLNERE